MKEYWDYRLEVGYEKKEKIKCKHCEYSCYKLKKHFMCNFRKCKKIDFNICLYNVKYKYCKEHYSIINKMEEYLKIYDF